MKKSLLFLLLCVPELLSALPKKPWFGNVYEFFFDAEYTFDYYRHVANAKHGTRHHSNDNQFIFGLGFTPSESWDMALEAEVSDTTRQSWNLRSVAAQLRYLLWDDIIGDPISLVTGLSIRGVHHSSLRDISCPYPAEANLELNVSLGKEWSRGPYWITRTFAFGTAGIANHGSPWTRFFAAFECNWNDKHQLHLFTRGDFGFGHRNTVNVEHFHGYASIHHKSVDVGIGYARHFLIWGKLTFDYAHRVYAHAYPERVNYFTIWYHLPFSFF
jgi:hypothetical protein